MSPLPPYNQLDLPQANKQEIIHALEGEPTPTAGELAKSYHATPLGWVRLYEICALYASPQRLRTPAITQAIIGNTSDLDKIFGDKWHGISAPTSLLSFLNPNPEAAAYILSQPQRYDFHIEIQMGRKHERWRTLDSMLHFLYYGINLPANTEAELLDRQIEVLTLIAQQPEHGDPKEHITLLDFLIPSHSPFARFRWSQGILTHHLTSIHEDPRIAPLYPQIRDAFLTNLNTGAPRGAPDKAEIQIEGWLQTLAQKYLQAKIREKNKNVALPTI